MPPRFHPLPPTEGIPEPFREALNETLGRLCYDFDAVRVQCVKLADHALREAQKRAATPSPEKTGKHVAVDNDAPPELGPMRERVPTRPELEQFIEERVEAATGRHNVVTVSTAPDFIERGIQANRTKEDAEAWRTLKKAIWGVAWKTAAALAAFFAVGFVGWLIRDLKH